MKERRLSENNENSYIMPRIAITSDIIAENSGFYPKIMSEIAIMRDIVH